MKMRWLTAMSRCIIVTLLIAGIGTLGIQAEENREQRTYLNGALALMNGGGIEALTVQNKKHYGTGPNKKNHYGSVVDVATNVNNFPDSSQPSNTQPRSFIAPGGLGQKSISYVQPNQNPTMQKGTILGALTNNRGHSYHSEPGSKIRHRSYLQRNYNMFKTKRSPKQIVRHIRSLLQDELDRLNESRVSESMKDWKRAQRLFKEIPETQKRLEQAFNKHNINSSTKPASLLSDKVQLFLYSLIILFTCYPF